MTLTEYASHVIRMADVPYTTTTVVDPLDVTARMIDAERMLDARAHIRQGLEAHEEPVFILQHAVADMFDPDSPEAVAVAAAVEEHAARHPVDLALDRISADRKLLQSEARKLAKRQQRITEELELLSQEESATMDGERARESRDAALIEVLALNRSEAAAPVILRKAAALMDKYRAAPLPLGLLCGVLARIARTRDDLSLIQRQELRDLIARAAKDLCESS